LSPDEKLAWRVVVLAGAPPLMTPPPLETAEIPYQQALKALEVEGGSPAERIQALKDASPEYLSAKIDKGIMFTPLVDSKFIPFQPTFDAILNGNPPWKNTSCEAAFVGYAPFDVCANHSYASWISAYEEKPGQRPWNHGSVPKKTGDRSRIL
jgi:hypothetical protein